jgi:hypothetical protein
LALFGRRPAQRADRFLVAGVQKPAQIRTHAVQQSSLFDHLIGAGEQRPIDVGSTAAGRRGNGLRAVLAITLRVFDERCMDGVRDQFFYSIRQCCLLLSVKPTRAGVLFGVQFWV